MDRAAPGCPTSQAGMLGTTADQPIVVVEHVSKAFSGVTVLDDVELVLNAGEVHALMGENGAGKSTLMKILAGVYVDYDGTITVGGRKVGFSGVRDAEETGIAIIHQELNLVPELTVAENIFLGREPLIAGLFVNRAAVARSARDLLTRLGIDIDPEIKVSALRVGEQQLVEIAKALSLDARVLIMDEPTSALSLMECRTLFRVVRQLTAAGVAIVYISHRIDEVMELAQRVTVLRDGRRVLAAPIAALDRDAIIAAMAGRALAALDHPVRAMAGDVVLSVRDLTFEVASPRGWRRVVAGVSFDLRRGEILGIGGLLGSGRTEVLEALFGARSGHRGGRVMIEGEAVNITSPAEARRRGLALVTEDRKAQGLLLGASIRDNVALPSLAAIGRFGLRAFGRECALADRTVRDLNVRCTGIEQTTATLSGGNQQKVVIGKWLATEPRILLLDEPTRGVDVGAKREIYDLIFGLADAGLGLIVVSSELPELLLLSDRILVMSEGRQTGLLSRTEATQEAVMRLAAPAARPHAPEVAA